MTKSSFLREKFWLNYSRPDDFTICFWQKEGRVLPIWIIYRAILAFYFILSTLLGAFIPRKGYLWYKSSIYLDFWILFAEDVAFTLALALSVERFIKEKKNPELYPRNKMPVLYKITWYIYSSAGPCALTLTIIFWIFLYNSETYPNIGLKLYTRGINTMCMLFDFSLNAIPYRYFHFYIPGIFNFTYTLFTYIYQISGGTGKIGRIPIYALLDWRNPWRALRTGFVLTLCAMLSHCGFCIVYMLKQYVKKQREEDTTQQ